MYVEQVEELSGGGGYTHTLWRRLYNSFEL